MPRTRRPLLALLALLVLLAIGYAVKAADRGGSSGAKPDRVAESSLPAEARHTIDLIEAHGPFPYDRDGIVFRNDEHELPTEPRGYYHEYTVPTPGESDRGPRRIVTGQDGEFYYTDDHYDSFDRVTVP